MKGSYILNNISTTIILILIITLGLIYLHDRHPKVYNYIEMKNTYKNCIIVGKENKDNTYKLKLYNPYVHENELKVDYVILVKDYIYFNKFIGDTIK